MIARLFLIIAIFAGLLGGQMEARSVCGVAQVCSGCCTPGSDESCCRASEKPASPATAPAASQTMDWKMIVQPFIALLPRVRAAGREALPVFSPEAPRVSGLARSEMTCVRLI